MQSPGPCCWVAHTGLRIFTIFSGSPSQGGPHLQPDGFILEVCLHRQFTRHPPAYPLPFHSRAVLQTPPPIPAASLQSVPSCIPSNIRASGFFPNPQLTMTLSSAQRPKEKAQIPSWPDAWRQLPPQPPCLELYTAPRLRPPGPSNKPRLSHLRAVCAVHPEPGKPVE